MGKKDAVTNRYVKNPVVFADICNYSFYRGEQYVKPEDLKPLDIAETALPYDAGGNLASIQKYRDVLKHLTIMTDGRVQYCIVGIENQTHIHYAMPVKNGLYDFLQLAGQIDAIEKKHRQTKDAIGNDEFLSGFTANDKLTPIVTTAIYWGEKRWDGPLTLREMYECNDEKILSMAPDYHVNLISPSNMSDADIDLFHSDFREVLLFLKNCTDKEKLKNLVSGMERFKHMDRDTVELLRTVTNAKLLKFDERKERVDVCKAIDDMWQEAKSEGKREGIEALILDNIEEGKTESVIKEKLVKRFSLSKTEAKKMYDEVMALQLV